MHPQDDDLHLMDIKKHTRSVQSIFQSTVMLANRKKVTNGAQKRIVCRMRSTATLDPLLHSCARFRRHLRIHGFRLNCLEISSSRHWIPCRFCPTNQVKLQTKDFTSRHALFQALGIRKVKPSDFLFIREDSSSSVFGCKTSAGSWDQRPAGAKPARLSSLGLDKTHADKPMFTVLLVLIQFEVLFGKSQTTPRSHGFQVNSTKEQGVQRIAKVILCCFL